jgi:hypothetical protein
MKVPFLPFPVWRGERILRLLRRIVVTHFAKLRRRENLEKTEVTLLSQHRQFWYLKTKP